MHEREEKNKTAGPNKNKEPAVLTPLLISLGCLIVALLISRYSK